ncbi:MAG: hypothetical protein JWO05_3071 [Gemmatimonadetes bacterium]|nr:hypothetical protein [Gemmatimonadota bacterium]
MADSILDAVCVVLFEPQDPINIAATVRAMKNMGVHDLRLVRPCEYEVDRMLGIAHNTHDVIERIQHFDSFDAAVADRVFVSAFTARRRAAKWQLIDPKQAATQSLAHAQEGPVAIVFGREDSGLPNEILDRAHAHVTIPTTEHASLNLAQAVLIATYELHLAAGDATRTLPPPRKDAPPASTEDLERWYREAEQSLDSIQFLKTRHSGHIMRTIRSLTFRAAPDAREIVLLQAIAIEVRKFMAWSGRNVPTE